MRRAADELSAVLRERQARLVSFGQAPLRSRGAALSGRRILDVSCRGKAVLLAFSGGLTVYTHNQLYGRWYVRPLGRLPATRRQLRLRVDTDAHSALLYSASDIGVYDEAGLASHPYLARLGPEALDSALEPPAVEALLRDRRFSGRALASLYLDQSFLAGIGNYLRSEIFFVARIAPTLRARDLDRNARRRLARASLAVPRRSYETGGITNAPATVKRLRAEGARRGQYRFFVFARAGRPCHACGAKISRAELGGRRLYFCPVCQQAP